LDGTELKRTYAESHIKRYFPRGRTLQEISQEELDPDEESLKDQPEEDEDNEAMDQSE
jgi:hypothetical protein